MQAMTVKPSVLIIDDEPDIRELLAMALAEAFDITLAASVDEAKTRLSEAAPDLMLLDLMMPGLSGGAFVQYLERFYPDLLPRVFLLTGMPPEIVKSMAPQLAERIIRKPIDFARISQQLRSLL
jgi:CheY-like chemotaxis protein